MADLAQFEKQSYLNIETFRKSGVGVKTPVWFVMEKNQFYIYTEAHSGKIKRVRNNPNVRISPCKFNGDVCGEWIEAKAIIIQDTALMQQIDDIFDRKYGLFKKIFDLTGQFSKNQKGYLHVTPI